MKYQNKEILIEAIVALKMASIKIETVIKKTDSQIKNLRGIK